MLDRGRKPGWVFYTYQAKFRANPPIRVEQIEPEKPSAETLAWVRSRDIAYAKARQKEAAA
jgi:hypothetical protein